MAEAVASTFMTLANLEAVLKNQKPTRSPTRKPAAEPEVYHKQHMKVSCILLPPLDAATGGQWLAGDTCDVQLFRDRLNTLSDSPGGWKVTLKFESN